MSTFACVSQVEDIPPKSMQSAKPLQKALLRIIRNMWMNRARMSSRRHWFPTIGRCLLQILDGLSRKSLVVRAQGHGTKNRIVRPRQPWEVFLDACVCLRVAELNFKLTNISTLRNMGLDLSHWHLDWRQWIKCSCRSAYRSTKLHRKRCSVGAGGSMTLYAWNLRFTCFG